MLKPLDYARVVSDKNIKKLGLNRGDVVMVASLQVAQAKKDDPYLQRVYPVVVKIVDGVHQIPSQDTDWKSYMVDGRSLDPLGEKESKEYQALLNKQYGEAS